MLKEILSVSGKPGLFKLVSQGRNNIIVESLTDGKRQPIYSIGGVMSMEDVAIYTEEDTISMVDVFKRIMKKENNAQIKDNPRQMTVDQLKAYFEEIIPEYDRDKVHVSDMKKTLSWYNEIVDKNLLSLLEEKEDANEETCNKEETK